MHDCIFCNIVVGALPSTPLYQDEDVMVIQDIHPQAPVHLLVLSKKHVSEFLEAEDALIDKIMRVVRKVIQEEKITNYRIVNNGKGVAFIDHVHVHILGNVDKMRAL